MEIYVVSDVGGTQIRVATYNIHDLTMCSQKKIATQSLKQNPTDRLINLIDEISKGHIIKAISIGVPGLINPRNGIIIEAPNVPGWINLPIREILISHFNVPVFLGNDANLAALGEWKFGAGIGHNNLLYLTISTGIGSGVIIDGQLLLGERGMAAEFGHVTILPDGPMCGCGHRGHIEALSSGTAISKYVTEELANGRNSSLRGIDFPSSKEIHAAARNGDELSIEAFSRAGKYLGIALANFIHMLNPSIVVFGGGVSQAGPLLFKPMQDALHSSIFSEDYLENIVITTAKLGDDVGLKGALALLLSKYQLLEISSP